MHKYKIIHACNTYTQELVRALTHTHPYKYACILIFTCTHDCIYNMSKFMQSKSAKITIYNRPILRFYKYKLTILASLLI